MRSGGAIKSGRFVGDVRTGVWIADIRLRSGERRSQTLQMNLSNNQACHVYFFNTHISSLSSTSRPWFLAPETWTIEKSTPRAPPVPIPVFRTFIQQLQGWLVKWTQDGQCPFIHRQLYADGFFPTFMQDAFSSISIHQSCNSRNQDMIARIIQDRAHSLIENAGMGGNSLMSAVPLLNTSQHLARVQALLIYQILRLFDNGVWQQARAEEAMPTLLSWCQQMWDSATLDCITTTSQTPDLVEEPAQQNCDAAPRLWRLCILSESIRRTWLAVMITISAYRTTKDGWCECAGGIMFTAHRSLWLASSSSQWETICRTEDPLFVPCLGNLAMVESCNPNEVDDFGFTCYSLIWGAEWVESWRKGHAAPPSADA